MTWVPFLGECYGSEGVVVLVDEKHAEGARITLECDAPVASFAVTCGIY
jgi:hypothetical protein